MLGLSCNRWVKGTGLIQTSGCGRTIDPTNFYYFLVFVVVVVVAFVVVRDPHLGTDG